MPKASTWVFSIPIANGSLATSCVWASFDSLTIRGGFMIMLDTDESDYITASWHWDGEDAVVFAVAPGWIEEPPL